MTDMSIILGGGASSVIVVGLLLDLYNEKLSPKKYYAQYPEVIKGCSGSIILIILLMIILNI